jgi:carbon-monoxide dehydrogenase large subunit
MIVEGQVHGGTAQGLAQALFEEVVYSEDGQLLTGTLMDYAVPHASQVPRYELDHTVTPTTVNPLGVKGGGEAGTIGSTPAVANAVMDALAPFGVTHIDMPLKPEKLWAAMQRGSNGHSNGSVRWFRQSRIRSGRQRRRGDCLAGTLRR